MSFLLRAALVIGALSYFAATRDQPSTSAIGPAATATATAAVRDPAATVLATGSTVLATVGSASAAWSALPAESRQRLAQDAMAELGRHVGTASVSRDTLADSDRKAAWRGAEGH
ncbi:hypothetical protein FV222_09795 [Methylobacterium sp. WL103]|uniref:hypothetical protein n=1 Tax=unclassified Methylobacterium TaxID=2615210 RepID=UPI0011C94F12|nr:MULTISPECIES: hypothetical protein [unclassified Methylobacterium]TXM76310.1 hypothetical protein FV226_01265 [Methylobacterium sp. WL12]TXN02215.1 hypothetical protein FV222_09795 [Methylobacterium sp. WL103]